MPLAKISSSFNSLFLQIIFGGIRPAPLKHAATAKQTSAVFHIATPQIKVSKTNAKQARACLAAKIRVLLENWFGGN
jgi:hypothetical protein